MKFFEDNEKIKSISTFLNKFEQVKLEDKRNNERFNICKTILKFIVKKPKQWDQYCLFNTAKGGKYLLDTISSFESSDVSLLLGLYDICYRLVIEFIFSLEDGSQLTLELREIIEFIEKDIPNLPDPEKARMTWSTYLMPAAIAKNYIQHKNINEVIKFNETSEQAFKLKEEWNSEIEAKALEVKKLKETLDKYEKAFNFVGLYSGFENIAKDKRLKKNILLFFTVCMGTIILSPLMTELFFIYQNIQDLSSYKSILLTFLLPTITLEIILIYFFRILLHNLNSVQAQLIQIDLRMTLCQFIQSYAEYAKDIKDNDINVLEKFENLIFSGLITNDEKLPSTYDGIEQLAKLVKRIKQ